MSQLVLAVPLLGPISLQEVTPGAEMGANQGASSQPSSSQRRYVGQPQGSPTLNSSPGDSIAPTGGPVL